MLGRDFSCSESTPLRCDEAPSATNFPQCCCTLNGPISSLLSNNLINSTMKIFVYTKASRQNDLMLFHTIGIVLYDFQEVLHIIRWESERIQRLIHETVVDQFGLVELFTDGVRHGRHLIDFIDQCSGQLRRTKRWAKSSSFTGNHSAPWFIAKFYRRTLTAITRTVQLNEYVYLWT